MTDMIKIVMPWAFGLLVFLLSFAICSKLLKGKTDTEARVNDLKGEEIIKVERKPRKVKLNKRPTTAKAIKRLELLEDELYDCGIKIPVDKFILIWSITAFALPSVLTVLKIKTTICLGVALIAAFGPILFVRIKKKKRKETLEGQLVEAISVLCNALKAGHSFQSAMQNITTEMNGPIAEEFGRVFRETQHGMSMEISMERMIERTQSDDVNMLCTAIMIQREVGGNLAEVLANIATTIQRRLDLKADIKTRTASGRLSGYIIGGLPFILLAAITAINPGYEAPMFATQLGKTLLMVGGVMEVIGFIVINKMISIKY